MRRAAAAVGLPAGDVELFRDSSAPLYRLAGHVARLCDDDGSAEHEHRIGEELDRARVPAARPIAPPVRLDGRCVLFSAWIDHDPVAPAWRDVGAAARLLHDHTTAPASTTAPLLAAIRSRLNVAAGRGLASTDEVALLGGLLDHHGARLEEIAPDDPLGWSVIHGDLHPGNVIMAGGGPVLVDLELTDRGPRTYDAIPAIVATERYRSVPDGLARYESGYGSTVPDWPGRAVMQTVYEVWLTIWSLTARGSGPRHEQEATIRLRHWTHGDPTPWSLL